jgi:lipopolysaccharide/colanic/teichoic acid biosynthesis glycosyltransferase
MQAAHEKGRASRIPVVDGFGTKRVFDLVVAAVLVVVLGPLFAIVGLAVKIDSRGSALFVQNRVGARREKRGDREVWDPSVFRAYKFRSMYHDADELSHRRYATDFVNGNATANEIGPRFKMVSDPRVTRVGRLIRRTSIDELPQLFNVLKGEMSLVGPRPVPTYEVDDYSPWHFQRFESLPGITGYWQVYGRGSVPFEEMVQMDIFYVKNRTLLMDLKLLLLTLPAVVSTRGAN